MSVALLLPRCLFVDQGFESSSLAPMTANITVVNVFVKLPGLFIKLL